MSKEEVATCRGCGRKLVSMGGRAYHPVTKEPCKVNFYGGFVCSRECDHDSSLALERSMPGHTGAQKSLSSFAQEHYNKNWYSK